MLVLREKVKRREQTRHKEEGVVAETKNLIEREEERKRERRERAHDTAHYTG